MITSENIKGKLIVFEGLDGCFKETNSKKLAEYIKENYNEKTVLMSYPQYDSESAYFVIKYLNKQYGEMKDIDPRTVSLFYALNRYDDKIKIDELLAEGYTVILDRYVGSNLLYQSARFDNYEDMDKFIDWCTDLEYNQNGLHKEDITLFMYIPVEINYKNLYNRTNKAGVSNDIYESNKAYQMKLDSIHEYVCDKLNWNIVKCYESHDMYNTILSTVYDKERIFSNILSILNSHFN